MMFLMSVGGPRMTKRFKTQKKDNTTIQVRLDDIQKTQEVQKWLDRKVKRLKEREE